MVFFFVLCPSQQLRSCRFSVHITKLEQAVTKTSCTYFCLSLTAKIVSEYDQEIPQSQTTDNCGTARKSLSTITRHQEDKLSKATSSLYPIKTFLNESTEWWRMTVEINLFHDQSSLKYRTGPGSNSLTP